MDKRPFFTRRVKAIAIAALAVALVLAVLAASGHGFLYKAAGTLMQPARSVSASLTRSFEQLYDYLFRYELLETENTQLQQRISAMEDEIERADQLARENERLRALLDLSEEHEDYRFVSAYITSASGTAWGSAFTIGKGTNSGIDVQMCVVDEFGHVIGLVTEAGPNWATVTTILDASVQISAQVSSSGYTGVVRGTHQTGEAAALQLHYLPADAVVAGGDQVVTTGSNLYPKGLLLGYVDGVSADETGLSRMASLTPAADFDFLEQVFVICDYTVQ